MATLTHKQKKFCEEYAFDYNGTRAYKAAYQNITNSNTAGAGASRLLRNGKIKDYIKEYQSDLEKSCGISKMMAVKELTKFAFHSFDDIHDSWIERKEFNSLDKDVKSCIQEIDTKILKKNIGTSDVPEIVDVEHIKIKLVDKRGALQDLAKLLGWNNPEKIIQTNLNHDVTNLTKDERQKLNDELEDEF